MVDNFSYIIVTKYGPYCTLTYRKAALPRNNPAYKRFGIKNGRQGRLVVSAHTRYIGRAHFCYFLYASLRGLSEVPTKIDKLLVSSNGLNVVRFTEKLMF